MQSTGRIRNIGILAHIDAGKTSVTERVLHVAGVRRVAGSVDDGTTATDYLPVEQQHGITIKTAAVRFTHKDIRFHLLDTPGHVDFSAEVDRVLRVLDGAVIVLCAVSGVQVRTGFIAKACRDHSLPRIYFINKMDRRGADFSKAVQEIQTELGETALPLQIPTLDNYRWTGIADLVREQWYPVNIDGGETHSLALDQAPLSSQSREEVMRARDILLERAAEFDDVLIARILENQPISPEMLSNALRPAILEQKLVPVLCGSSFEDTSISLLLDAVIDFFPSPEERGCPPAADTKTGEEIRLGPFADESLSAYIFKTMVSRDLEPVAWLRIWSGTMRENARVAVMPAGKTALIQRLYGVNGAEVERIAEASAGEIVGARISHMEPGATVCAPSLRITYEAFKTPEPLVFMVIEPESSADLPLLREALSRYAMEDISLSIKEEKETGRITLEGQGELHLEIVRERLRKEYGLKVRTGNPQVPKVEQLKNPCRIEERFSGDFGGERLEVLFGASLAHLESSAGNQLSFAEGVRLPKEAVEAIRHAMDTALAVGPSEGWPVVGVLVTVERCVPPSGSGKKIETAIEAAASIVLRKAVQQAGTRVLVPIVQIAVEVPDEWFGPVLALLQARGARIEAVEDTGGIKSILAYAPMEQMFGFASALRARTEGRGIYQARFDHYGDSREY